jgi:hypothetical protein
MNDKIKELIKIHLDECYYYDELDLDYILEYIKNHILCELKLSPDFKNNQEYCINEIKQFDLVRLKAAGYHKISQNINIPKIISK